MKSPTMQERAIARMTKRTRMLAAQAAAHVAEGDFLALDDDAWRRAMAPHAWAMGGRWYAAAHRARDNEEPPKLHQPQPTR